jgi:hypothetical protein
MLMQYWAGYRLALKDIRHPSLHSRLNQQVRAFGYWVDVRCECCCSHLRRNSC